MLWLGLLGGGVLVWVLFFGVAVLSGTNVNQPGSEGLLTAFGLAVVAGPVGNLVGLALGVAGLIRREPRPALSILGIVLNGLFVLGAAALGCLAWFASGV